MWVFLLRVIRLDLLSELTEAITQRNTQKERDLYTKDDILKVQHVWKFGFMSTLSLTVYRSFIASLLISNYTMLVVIEWAHSLFQAARLLISEKLPLSTRNSIYGLSSDIGSLVISHDNFGDRSSLFAHLDI